MPGNVKKERWLQVEVFAPSELLDALANFLTELGAHGISEETLEPPFPEDFPEVNALESLKAYFPYDVRREHRLAALTTYIEDLAGIFPEGPKPTFKTELIEDPNWGEAWKKYFKPLRVSRDIVIKPTWERYTPAGRDIVIDIDPGMAFGTGQHPSTRMCLEALEDVILKHRDMRKWRVLDVGTGTGILGIACAKLGADRVVCVDIDNQAVEIARENVNINKVQDRVTILNRDATTIREPFDLIVANLTARILIKLRDHLASILDRQGYLIISGIIEQNREDIEKHFLTDSFKIHRMITEKDWLCYAFLKER